MRKYLFWVFILAPAILLWDACQQTEKKNDKNELNQEHWIGEGKKIAESAQKALGENLIAALQEGGPTYAVEFCNSEAIPLTDSASLAMNVDLKRVSDKNRNPVNRANEEELQFINYAKEQLAKGEEIHPAIKESGGQIVGLYPIITNEMCLNCHGRRGEEILDDTYEKIKHLYPEDLATGYRSGEIRGLWVVTMDEE